MFNIALIMPVYNGLQFTKNSLQSLFHTCEIDQVRSKVDIVIVDDNSTDGSYAWIQKNYPKVILIKGSGNLWWSGGINRGVEYTLKFLNPDYIIWWNNDILPDEDYFENLIQILETNNIKNIIGSKIFRDDKYSDVWSMGGVFDPRSGKKGLIGSDIKDNINLDTILEADWLPGMGTIMHRSVYEEIGFVDEARFPQYHGDSDFTFRAKKAGFNITVSPELMLYNDTSNSGIKHNDGFVNLFRSLTSIKSNYNIRKEFLFYKIHSTSIVAYYYPIKRYIKYIGGFIKWKLLGMLGKKRSINNRISNE